MPEGIEPISQVQNRSHYEAGCMAIFSILDCIDLLGTLLFFIWHLESNGFLVLLFWRFKTGAFTRQGVRPSSQYLIALIHSAHCIFIWRQEWGLCNTIFGG